VVPFSCVCKRLSTATGGTLGNVLPTSTDHLAAEARNRRWGRQGERLWKRRSALIDGRVTSGPGARLAGVELLRAGLSETGRFRGLRK